MSNRWRSLPVLLVGVGGLVLGACSSSTSTSDGSSDGTSGSAAPGTTPGTTGSAGVGSEESSTADGYDFAAVAPIVEEFIDANDLNGAGLVVVDAEDGVVYEDYWGEFDADRISLIASSSKMISAGVLLNLADQGLLDIDAPVADVAPWGAGNPDITPAQLISNSSGLVGLLPEPAYSPYLCQYVAVNITLQGCAEAIFTTDADDDQVIPPDTEFRYGGAQWQVAGAVAESASGKSWAELVDEIYVQPCGLETLGYNNHFTQLGPVSFSYPTAFGGDPATLQPTENPNMEGGVYIAPPDYAKLLLMHLRDGRCGDTQVLSPEALERLHSDRIGPAYGGSASAGAGAAGGQVDQGYGMGWWVNRSNGQITDPGAYGSVPWLDLEDGYGAYLVIEDESQNGVALYAMLAEAVDAAVNAA